MTRVFVSSPIASLTSHRKAIQKRLRQLKLHLDLPEDGGSSPETVRARSLQQVVNNDIIVIVLGPSKGASHLCEEEVGLAKSRGIPRFVYVSRSIDRELAPWEEDLLDEYGPKWTKFGSAWSLGRMVAIDIARYLLWESPWWKQPRVALFFATNVLFLFSWIWLPVVIASASATTVVASSQLAKPSLLRNFDRALGIRLPLVIDSMAASLRNDEHVAQLMKELDVAKSDALKSAERMHLLEQTVVDLQRQLAERSAGIAQRGPTPYCEGAPRANLFVSTQAQETADPRSAALCAGDVRGERAPAGAQKLGDSVYWWHFFGSSSLAKTAVLKCTCTARR